MSYAAISEVVAEWVALHEATLEDQLPSPRSLKDRVRRALQGELLEPRTLRWLTDAFEMNEQDTTRLFDKLSGRGEIALHEWPPQWRTLPPGGHRTRSLNEWHVVGADRRPVRHRTVQVIEAEGDDLSMYPFRFDTAHAVVIVEQGGRAGPVYREREGLWCCNLQIDPPVRPGHTTSIVYETRFFYEQPPAPEFRRGSRRAIEAVNLAVEFHPDAVPTRVTWGRWTGDGEVVDAQDVRPVNLVVERFVRMSEGHVVGFTWEW